jgi:hypothetical protein
MFVDTTRRRLYVIGGEGFVDVFSIDATYNRLARLATAPGARTGLFVKQQNRLYVAVPHRNAQRASVLVFDAR